MDERVEDAALKLTAMLSAGENWAPLYSQVPEQHANLIKAEAHLQLVLTRFFRNMQSKVHTFVNWDHYNYQVQLDYDVRVIVNDQQIDDDSGLFIKVSFSDINKIVQASWAASEVIYNISTNTQPTSALIQELSTKQVANLVGRRVLSDGAIVDNPDASYNILETVRNDIAQSIKTSLGLGESTDEAISRMSTIINPIDRAELIAQTESVNAWSAGVTAFGDATNAKGEEWLTAGATDVCADYARRGVQPFGTGWDGLAGPTAHPRCRCNKRLIYQEEWDSKGYGRK